MIINTLGKHYYNKTAQGKILQDQKKKTEKKNKQNEQQHNKNRNGRRNEVIIQGKKMLEKEEAYGQGE